MPRFLRHHAGFQRNKREKTTKNRSTPPRNALRHRRGPQLRHAARPSKARNKFLELLAQRWRELERTKIPYDEFFGRKYTNRE